MKFSVIEKLEKKYPTYISVSFENETSICEYISEINRSFIKKMMERDKFTSKENEVLKLTCLENNEIVEFIFIGAGRKENFLRNNYRISLFKVLKTLKDTSLIYSENEELLDAELISEVCNQVSYTFDKYKIDKKEEKIIEVALLTEKKFKLDEIEILNSSTNIAKDLINEQANIITPQKLAELAIEYGKNYGFQVEILEEDQIKELGMEAFLAVGRASMNRPRLIVMRYFGNSESNYIYGLVGKGLTYDTGGLCLKPADGMFTMKDDMGGAATVIGAMCAIAKNRLNKNVVSVVAACENSIGPNAYRPGDIVGSMSGKYIEVINTDAEGRLTLADALTYIKRKENVSEIIDVATLTGGIVVALGSSVTGAFTNKKEMYLKFEKASEQWEEKYWQMPIVEENRKAIKSEIATLKNSVGRYASAPGAAAFLEAFIEENTPWLHLDIAGTAYITSDTEYHKKGATGVGVKTIYSYIKKGE